MPAADLDFGDYITKLIPYLDNGAVRHVALSKIGSHEPSKSNGIFRRFKITTDGKRGHIDLSFAAIALREQKPKIGLLT